MRFEFVIKLKAAKQFGLTIPQSVLYRADKVSDRRKPSSDARIELNSPTTQSVQSNLKLILVFLLN